MKRKKQVSRTKEAVLGIAMLRYPIDFNAIAGK
jgi:hypothetical protein